MENIFKGLGIALVTPFLEDGEVDFASLEKLIEFQIQGGIDFLCILGSTAETPCLSTAEKSKIVKFVVKQVSGRVPLLLGFGGNNTRELCDEIRSFDFTGINGILSVCPFYNKPSQEGIYRHFVEVAKSTNLPVVLYNVPGRTGVNILADTTLRLARDCDNIVAIKEASGKVDQIEEIIQNAPQGFDVISGDDALTYELITKGAKGVISVIGNAMPRNFGNMVHDTMNGNFESAQSQNTCMNEIYHLLSVDGNPSGIKAMLSAFGKCKNVLRLPLVPARKETQERLFEEGKLFS